jgi:hypothetical protein
LGQQEIAVMQTTSLDETARLLRLNTVLAHSSGEWIASDWPVCPLSDVSSPQRMGAALTYARRYGLFALVGIAGEDDLDAPDLHDVRMGRGGGAAANSSAPQQGGNGAAARRHSAVPVLPRRPLLAAEDSALRRGALLAEIAGLASSDQAQAWALRTLPEKNRLAAEDAAAVETAFSERTQALTSVGGASAETVTGQQGTPAAVAPEVEVATGSVALAIETAPSDASSKTSAAVALPQRLPTAPPSLAKTKRRRDPEHLRFVAAQPCLICGRLPADAHHLRFAQVRALGRKASDEFTVPLCRMHHREAHRTSNEKAWWTTLGIKPLEVARRLWLQSHGEPQFVSKPLPAVSDVPPKGARSGARSHGSAVALP